MILEKLFGLRKYRKYPIKRDDRGQSLRAGCFQLFDEGKRPVEVARELAMKKSTVQSYFRQWKLIGPDFEKKYTYVRELLKKSAPNRDHNLELYAKACGISKEEFEAVLAKPHGLRRLMTGKLYFPGHASADHKREVALELALLISDHLVKNGGQFGDVLFAFESLMKARM